ncbi:DUF350 domain-containing protein [Sulfuriroseicoccus oceanibius]|uniref:DUF350 domain-containing protein n=1 Tax=Sulfuriroseicoccus oceanibius TaxID=2707525 RepID=A0A6B3LDL1_9BACT|nr:DUF350 domain-containing protein [Sulfuriroseicoccus oceanibius]QQL45673.1 DUF350 domain-containing protein [Sulfuriroseicoccus oceanibius]
MMTDLKERVGQWFDVEPVYHLIGSGAAIYFVVALLLVYVAKFAKGRAVSFALNEELTQKDNKAVGVSTVGYLLGVMIVIRGVLVSDADAPLEEFLISDVLMTVVWSLVSVGLLLLSAVVNDKWLLHSFCNRKELIEDRNVGTGAVVASSYVGTALLIAAAVRGASEASFVVELVDTLVYFVVGQLAFIITGVLYQRFTGYDIHAEIERDNVAAGVSFGLTLIAVAVLLSGYLQRNDSLIGFAAWIPLSIVLLLTARALVDRFLIYKSSIKEEIARDQNWGVALVEGGVALGVAFILNAAFA